MWLVVHETYAENVYLDGRDLTAEDFKPTPEGHTGGALNMVPAYAGYMAINSITGDTRSWIMGQGHTVAAIDSVNLLLDNMSQAHEERYSLSDEGLSATSGTSTPTSWGPTAGPTPPWAATSMPTRRAGLPREATWDSRSSSTSTCPCRGNGWWPS